MNGVDSNSTGAPLAPCSAGIDSSSASNPAIAPSFSACTTRVLCPRRIAGIADKGARSRSWSLSRMVSGKDRTSLSRISANASWPAHPRMTCSAVRTTVPSPMMEPVPRCRFAAIRSPSTTPSNTAPMTSAGITSPVVFIFETVRLPPLQPPRGTTSRYPKSSVPARVRWSRSSRSSFGGRPGCR